VQGERERNQGPDLPGEFTVIGPLFYSGDPLELRRFILAARPGVPCVLSADQPPIIVTSPLVISNENPPEFFVRSTTLDFKAEDDGTTGICTNAVLDPTGMQDCTFSRTFKYVLMSDPIDPNQPSGLEQVFFLTVRLALVNNRCQTIGC